MPGHSHSRVPARRPGGRPPSSRARARSGCRPAVREPNRGTSSRGRRSRGCSPGSRATRTGTHACRRRCASGTGAPARRGGSIPSNVETGMRVRGQAEGRDVETHLRGRRRDRGREPSRCVHDHRRYPYTRNPMAANAPRPTRLATRPSPFCLRGRQQRLTPTRRLIVDVLEAGRSAAHDPGDPRRPARPRPELGRTGTWWCSNRRVVHRFVTHHRLRRYELAEDLTGQSPSSRVLGLRARRGSPGDGRGRALGGNRDRRGRTPAAGLSTEHHRLDLVGLCADCSAAADTVDERV